MGGRCQDQKSQGQQHVANTDTTPPQHSDVKKVAKACDLMSRQKYGKARRHLLSLGTSDAKDPDIASQLESKHPIRLPENEIPDMTTKQLEHHRADLDFDTFRQTIHSAPTDVAPGLGGLRYEHCHALLYCNQVNLPEEILEAVQNFYNLSNKIVQGSLPSYFYDAFTAVRLAPVNKKTWEELQPRQTMDVQPIGVGNCMRRLITKALMKPLLEEFVKIMSPIQLGDGVRAGATKIAFTVGTHMSMNPDHCTIGMDVKNAFNSYFRKASLEALWHYPPLRSLYFFLHTILSPKSYVGLGSGQYVIDASFLSQEGGQQGAIEASIMFDLVAHYAANSITNAELESDFGCLRGG